MSPQDVLEFWFDDNDDVEPAFWWSKDPAADRDIAERFAELPEQAADGKLQAWRSTAQGRLALILATDQFPRNMYRGSARAFAYDTIALQECQEGLERRDDQALRPVECVFFYLPLEHAEDLALQDRCVALFRQLLDRVPSGQRQRFQNYLDYALAHRDVVARFGRFPHRNAVLGRESSAEERAYLAQPGSGF